MKKIFEPITINGLQLKNRVVMSPMGMGITDYAGGRPTERLIQFYVERAKGGVGLIICGDLCYDKVRHEPNNCLYAIDDQYIPGLKELTDAVHAAGARIFGQLLHMGRWANAFGTGEQNVAPSVTVSPFNGNQVPREMTKEDIADFVRWQGEAALRCKKAGFDGVELETNSGYLHGQFFSPVTNLRTDEYGCQSLENRTRFTRESLRSIREQVGADFPVTMRVSGSDFTPGGCDDQDIRDICHSLSEDGLLDAISVAAGWHTSSIPLVTMELPNATYAYLGRGIREKTGCVVMQGMRMNIPTAAELIERGDIDMVVMGRPLLCDPQLVNKAAAGREEDIRPCIACNAGCLDAGMKMEPIGCVSNYECNRESLLRNADGLLPTELSSPSPERILVIGAGPAGMEFARVAALRGHRVTVWEKRDRTRGLTKYAATPPRRQEIHRIGMWLEHSCRALGVEFLLEHEATEEKLLAVKNDFDRFVFACGSRAALPPIPTQEGAQVCHAWDVLEGSVKLGKNVAIIGGGDVGIETAMFIGEIGTISAEQLRFHMIFNAEPFDKLKELLNKGSHKVSVIEMGKKFAPDINPGCRWSIMARTKQLGVKLYNLTKVMAIEKDGVVVENAEGKFKIAADTIVIAAGAKPNNALFEAVKDALPNASVIGDAVTVARIPQAIEAGYTLAASI